jgi:hypothetical protein
MSDGRFKVMIKGPTGETQSFLLRERHPLRKVHQGASKHFGVDPHRLVILQTLFHLVSNESVFLSPSL